MGEPALTSAANVEEGNEIRIGGRWVVVEGVEVDYDTTNATGDYTYTLWAEEAPNVFAGNQQLAVCK